MTYSIAAVDQLTREVGGAGTSCLGGEDVYVIYAAVPGRGIVQAQARYSLAGKQRAIELLEQGQAPADIVSAITQASFDGNAAVRQYGIVDVEGNAAGFTGDQTMPYADDRQASVGTLTYSVQGNILTSAAVLDQAAAAFEGGGCDLAERLMSALEAGAQGGEGDSRCTPDGIPSDSAFLQVESPDAEVGGYLALRVESSGAQDPLPLLRAKLDAWRAEHPCPVVMVPVEPAGGTAGVAGSAGAPTSAGTSGTSGSAGTSTSGAASTTAGASASSDTSASSEGCACHVTGTDSAAGGWLLLGCLLVVARWRRRSARQLHPIQAT